MRKKIPSLNALTIFEAAARHQSFTRAAEEMALTQSAVCRQIAGLEEYLGLPLFARIKKRVILTPAGRQYAERIRVHIDRIERDTLELMAQQDGGGVLELAVVPTFATQWLIPRLAEFNRQRPDITVNLHTRTDAFLFSESSFHAAIHSGNVAWPGTAGDFLLNEGDTVPVCSPALLQRFKQQSDKNFNAESSKVSPQDIAGLPLLHLTTRLNDWRSWFELHGHRNDVSAVKGARYELFTMLVSAAVAGLGIALIPRFMVQAELAAGALAIPLELSLSGTAGYYLAYPEEHASFAPLTVFREWLLDLAHQC
ncbi:LysR substrate-binding domain-containing protein [Undibacterium sp.]|jgi:DNA-binding transcriptional LysR family regulator|uniref:LysR substrate-binding domain-containing protein n=1 Tax=Undibacterium sp. TaxID=1914977 RepID=UPI002B9FFB69|nr:LysR substrate-binding domain-containing protein [Undibacterium sp.]HTD06519.1 LysR substrate-binding domain-containing protein [Undibacterium sp.]